MYDVCVIGSGVMGAHAALALADRGAKVLLIDAHAPPHSSGSSHGSTRVIREAYFEDPLYVPLVQRAYDLWHELEVRAANELLTQTGGLMIGSRDGELLQGAVSSALQHGLPFEWLDEQTVREQFPLLRVAPGLEAILEPRAGLIRAEAAVQCAIDLAREANVTVRFNEPVRRWRADGASYRIETGEDAYQAARVVIATGPWIEQLVGGALKVEVARQPALWFEPRRNHNLFRCDVFPVFLWETAAGPIYYGFPLDRDGFKVARHHEGRATSPESIDRRVLASDEAPLRAFLADAIPDANGRRTRGSVCMYTNTRDNHFVVDRLPTDEGIVVVSACSGHGFKFAPAIAELVAQLALDDRPRFDLTAFSLSRRALQPAG
jgi:sarcosine oxidase